METRKGQGVPIRFHFGAVAFLSALDLGVFARRWTVWRARAARKAKSCLCLGHILTEDNLQSGRMIRVRQTSDAVGQDVQRFPRFYPRVLIDDGVKRPVEKARPVVRGQIMRDVYGPARRRQGVERTRDALVPCRRYCRFRRGPDAAEEVGSPPKTPSPRHL